MPTGITMAKTNVKSVDEYIASQPEAARGARSPRALFRGVEAALLALSRHRSRRRGVQGRPCTVQGQQGHDPLPPLRARPREVDRAHREVPREGSRRAREGESSRAEEALGRASVS